MSKGPDTLSTRKATSTRLSSMSSIESLSQLERLLVTQPPADGAQDNGDRTHPLITFDALLTTLRDLRQQNQHDGYLTALRLLADAARHERWRTPYHEYGILRDVLDSWAVTNPRALSKQVLRLWGNSCIDNEENRQVAAAIGFEKLSQALQDPKSVGWDHDICTVAVNALYNTCLDCEPAQQLAVLQHLHDALVNTLEVSGWDDGSSVYELVAMLTTRAGEVDHALLHFETLEKLLRVAHARCGPQLDAGYLLTAVMAYFTANPSFWTSTQASQAARNALLLLDTYDSCLERWPTTDEDEDRQSAAGLQRDAITMVVDSYDPASDEDSPLFESCFIPWLNSGRLRLAECACLVLGNQALKSPKLGVRYVEEHVQEPLLLIVVEGKADLALKHAAAGFLTALALPVENKNPLMKAGKSGSSIIWAVVSSLLKEKDFTLIKDAFTLFSAFVRGSVEACRFMLLPEQADSIVSPLGVITSTSSKMHGNSPFTADPLAACARGITTMTRMMLKPGMPSIDRHVETFLNEPGLLYPLTETFRHSEDKARRLDCSVGLARIACSHPEGAAVVGRAMSSEAGGLLDAIMQTRSGEDKEVRANCHILVESVLRLARADCKAQVQEDLMSIQQQLVANPG